jgi:hypothetical protein
VGQDLTSLQCATVNPSQSFSAPGTETLSVDVCDAAGWTKVAAREVAIAELGAVVPPTATLTDTRPRRRQPTHLLAVPAAEPERDTLDLHAGLWNRPPGNVTWTYGAGYH